MYVYGCVENRCGQSYMGIVMLLIVLVVGMWEDVRGWRDEYCRTCGVGSR